MGLRIGQCTKNTVYGDKRGVFSNLSGVAIFFGPEFTL